MLKIKIILEQLKITVFNFQFSCVIEIYFALLIVILQNIENL